MKLSTLQDFMLAANADDKKKLAKNLGISVNYLYQYNSNDRKPSDKRALQIERFTTLLSKQSKGRLPAISRHTFTKTFKTEAQLVKRKLIKL